MKIIVEITLCLLILSSCMHERKIEDKDSETRFVEESAGVVSATIPNDYEFEFSNDEASDIYNEAIEESENGNFEKALDLLDRALELEPHHPRILNNIGAAEISLGNNEKAIFYLNESIKYSDSLYFNAGVNLGYVYYIIGEYEKSILISKYVLDNVSNSYTQGSAALHVTISYLEMENCAKANKYFVIAESNLKNVNSMENQLISLDKEIKNCKY